MNEQNAQTTILEIYSRPDCIYCVKAKELFSRHNVKYVEHTIGENGVTRETIQERIGGDKKVSTIPQVFAGEKYIGAYVETLEFFAHDQHTTLFATE